MPNEPVLAGRLLAESLREGVDLSVADLVVTRLCSHDVSNSTTGTQPPAWTFVDFEAPASQADTLAQALADALSPTTVGTPISRSATTIAPSSPAACSATRNPIAPAARPR